MNNIILLSVSYQGVRAENDWFIVAIMCPSEATCIPVDCQFSEATCIPVDCQFSERTLIKSN